MNFHLKKKHIKAILLFLVFAFVFAGVFYLLDAWERFMEIPYEGESADRRESIVEIDGVPYALREDLTTLLLLGIDKTGEMKAVESNLNDAQCDFLTLIIFNKKQNTYTLLQLNRDTIAPVPILGIGGKSIGNADMQLALSHTYGDGMEESCENSVTAVENLLCGAPVIDHYLAVNMTGLACLVDAVGGVNVTIREDFSQIEPSLIEGETMLLNGEQCVTYLRGRHGVGDQTNLSRLERQKAFMQEFFDGMQGREENGESVNALREAASYMLTDLSGNRLSDFTEDILAAELTEIVSPEGEAVVGDEFMEFYADEQSISELVIRLFCTSANE